MNIKMLSSELLSLYPKESTGISRRDFVVTTLGAGFALAVQPAFGAATIATDTKNLTTGEAKIPVKEGSFPAYFAKPEAATNVPVILVVQEIFGVHEYIKDICRRLAKQGYLAIAPELFARQGDPAKIAEIPEILSQIVSKVPDEQVLADLDACTEWAKEQGGDLGRLGITGFCWGGRIVWLYASHNPRVRAGVAWYGKLSGPKSSLTPKQPVDIAGKLHAPILGLYAEEDNGIPVETVKQMKEALAATDNSASKASTIHVYPNVPHAFHADYRPSYRKAEAEDGWRRLLAWFSFYQVK